MSSGVVAVHHRSAGARTMNNSGRVSSRILASLPLRSWLLSWWTELVGSSQRLGHGRTLKQLVAEFLAGFTQCQRRVDESPQSRKLLGLQGPTQRSTLESPGNHPAFMLLSNAPERGGKRRERTDESDEALMGELPSK